jgi:hypothetical protein
MAETSPFELRASQAHQWVRCTGYLRMASSAPDIGDPEIRDQGICFHWAALMVWLGHAVNEGQRVQIDGMSQPIEIDGDMLDAIDDYLDRMRAWPGKARLEDRVSAPRIHPSCGGTVDAWHFDMAQLILDVADAKYGFRFIDPYQNWQLLVYVCGLLDHIGIVDDRTVTVRMWIYQPRAYRRGGPWFKWEVNASQLRAHFNTLRNAAEEVLSPRARCVTGSWCGDCNGRLNCDAFAESVENALEAVSEPIAHDLTPAQTDAQLVRIDRAVDILEARQSALKARAEMFMRDGAQLQHYQLQGGQARLQWKPEVVPALSALAQTKQIKLFNQKPITPTQAKKLLDPAMVDALSDRPSGKLKVTRVDGDRAARIFGQTSET